MKNLKLTKTLLFILLISTWQVSVAQQTQTVRGVIMDAQSEAPLIGATIMLVSDDVTNIGASTDENGRFVISDVPIGRQTFRAQYISYEVITLPNILVTVGKEAYLEVKLEESLEQLEEIVVTAESDKDKPINDLAMVSARTFNLEEVTRFSGGRGDVARLAGNFAGVSTADDSRNDIVIRGNSPTGVLWRLEGVPIPNPNHFSTLGTTGGPVSALNTNLLKTSDFMTGAFAAEYGNALAGVFDIGFRSGNKENFEVTAQVAAIGGVELMLEGPISKKKNSSFIASYRYSFISLGLIPIGTNALPNYQDLSFKLDLGNSKLGRFTVFGIGGLSDINFLGEDIEKDDLFANPDEDAYVNSRLGVAGLSHTIFFNNSTYLKTVLAATNSNNSYLQDNYIGAEDAPTKIKAVDVENNENRYIISSYLNTKFSPRFTLRTGALLEYYDITSNVISRDNRPDSDGDGEPDWVTVTDFRGALPLLQVYSQGQYRFTKELTLNLGIHGQYLEFNDSYTIEPRVGLKWDVAPDHTFSLAYGLHSQMQPLPILLYEEEVSPGVYEKTNQNLEFTRSHHYVLGYDWKIGANWRLKAETYYQNITDVPVEKSPGSYSALNEGADFGFTEIGSLVNKGTGFNYGLDITLEKFFSNDYYTLFTGSLFNSRYKGSDGIERNTAFNNQYVFNALAGKEFKFGRDKRNAFTLDTKVTLAGGRYYTPIDLEATIANNGEEVLQRGVAFNERYTPYFRLDMKVGYRLNSKKKKLSQQFFLDFQNITDNQNIFAKRYNEVTNNINNVYQIGFFVDILYRLQF